ncbi:hypothetical protein V1508DRAFT_394499 [Lipomyces doorenjongii]|uniref:uncharacterized protein n=1 Tax=Lipomyces doorenjongii TaxID=383834 RepID=UPI0034CDFAD1
MDFLTANEPERWLDIHLSYQSFRYLEEEARALYGDAKYPRVEYSAIDLRVTIHTIPTALHSASAVGLDHSISNSVRDILRRHDKEHLGNRILPVGESTHSSVDEQGVGISEGYQQLKADVELWLTFVAQGEAKMWIPMKSAANSSGDTVTVQGNSLDIGLIMGDVFPFDEELSADERTESICLATDSLLPMIESATHRTAMKRHNDFLTTH